jgi:hypothetical protein
MYSIGNAVDVEPCVNNGGKVGETGYTVRKSNLILTRVLSNCSHGRNVSR